MNGENQAGALRGAIDRFEEDLAVVVMDDDQQLVLPRAQLPQGARSGNAVVLSLGESGTWHALWQPGGSVRLDDAQSLVWPGTPGVGETWLSLSLDPAATAARRGRVQGLLRDLFGDEP